MNLIDKAYRLIHGTWILPPTPSAPPTGGAMRRITAASGPNVIAMSEWTLHEILRASLPHDPALRWPLTKDDPITLFRVRVVLDDGMADEEMRVGWMDWEGAR